MPYSECQKGTTRILLVSVLGPCAWSVLLVDGTRCVVVRARADGGKAAAKAEEGDGRSSNDWGPQGARATGARQAVCARQPGPEATQSCAQSRQPPPSTASSLSNHSPRASGLPVPGMGAVRVCLSVCLWVANSVARLRPHGVLTPPPPGPGCAQAFTAFSLLLPSLAALRGRARPRCAAATLPTARRAKTAARRAASRSRRAARARRRRGRRVRAPGRRRRRRTSCAWCTKPTPVAPLTGRWAVGRCPDTLRGHWVGTGAALRWAGVF
jgi:hypothetical protein